jgi:hypothetical protein
MQMTFLTLTGFTLTALCASICPMNMGGVNSMMSMDHGEMQMMEHAMDMSGDQKEMPCKRCDQDEEEVVAVSTPSVKVQAVAHAPFATLTSVSLYTDTIHTKKLGLPLANVGPPPQPHSLVGTVILRT